MMDKQGVSKLLSNKLNFKLKKDRKLLDDWEIMANHVNSLEEIVTIAMVGKYTGLSDSYLSVIKALQHSSYSVGRKLIIDWIESNNLEDEVKVSNPELYEDSWRMLKEADGILVPGGFGSRGIEGKIKAAKYARENKVPYLGVCLGLQIATIEFCRNVLGIENANSAEFAEDTENPVIIFMPEISKTHKQIMAEQLINDALKEQVKGNETV